MKNFKDMLRSYKNKANRNKVVSDSNVLFVGTQVRRHVGTSLKKKKNYDVVGLHFDCRS